MDLVENELKEFLAELESWYVGVCRAGSNMDEKVPEKYQAAIKSVRLLVCSSENGIFLQVRAGFRTFPNPRVALLEDMKSHYGLSLEKLKVSLVYGSETSVVHIDTVW